MSVLGSDDEGLKESEEAANFSTRSLKTGITDEKLSHLVGAEPIVVAYRWHSQIAVVMLKCCSPEITHVESLVHRRWPAFPSTKS